MVDLTTQNAKFGDTDNTLLLKIAAAIQGVATGGVADPNAVHYTADSPSGGEQTQARSNLGLGTMATQNANNVAITGGSVIAATFNGLVITPVTDGTLTIPDSSAIVFSEGGTVRTMAFQAADNVAITGGTISGVTIAGVAASGANSDITSLSALSTPLSQAQGGTGLAELVKVSVHKNGTDQTGIATGVYTKLTWSTEEYDTGNDFASDEFTAPVDGYYEVALGVWMFSTSDVATAAAAIYRDTGGGFTEYKKLWSNNGAAMTCGKVMVFLSAGHKVAAYLYHSQGADGTAYGLATATWFQIRQLP